MKVCTRSILSLWLLLSIFSCSSLVESLRKDDIPLKPAVLKAGYCPILDDVNLLGTDKTSVEIFYMFLSKAPALSKIERMVAWSLFQMNIRPDLATPSSRFQILTHTQNGTQYWDFKDSALDMDIPKGSPPMTFIYGLETLLKSYPSKRNLRNVAQLLDTHLPLKIPVSADFAKFIGNNKDKLFSNQIFRTAFFKADEQLRYGESLPKLSYSKIIQNYYQYRSRVEVQISTSNELYSYPLSGSDNKEALCNMDLLRYSKSKYDISDSSQERNHPFGMSFGKNSFFIGVTSVANINFRPLLGTFLIETTQGNTSTSICYTNGKNAATAYLSFKGRDPGQFLFNLFQYNIHHSTGAEELDQFLKFPRHLVLNNPIRILFESDRASDKDVDKFLRQNIPVYHSHSLGEIWLYSPNSGFVVDDRGKAHLSCMK